MHDVNPVRRTPWITYGLIAANVTVFLMSPAYRLIGFEETASAADLCAIEAFYHRYGAIPLEMMQNEPLQRVPTGEVAGVEGDSVACLATDPSYSKSIPASVFYSMFLHAGWLHLLGNMLFLWVFGNNVEDRFGRLRFLLFYLLAGFIAAYGFALADPAQSVPLVGASGAVSAVLGAYLMLYPRARVWSLVPFLLFLPLKLPAWFVLGLWFVLQYLYSSGYLIADAGNVAFLAHVVGFLFGMAIGLGSRVFGGPVPELPRRARTRRDLYRRS